MAEGLREVAGHPALVGVVLLGQQADVVDVHVERDPAIDNDTWLTLDAYLNGKTDLRNKLKQLCKVDDLRNIKRSQMDAVRGYSKSYIKAQKQEDSAAQAVAEQMIDEEVVDES